MYGIYHWRMPYTIYPHPGRPGQSLFAIGPFGFTREERVNGVGVEGLVVRMQPNQL